MRDVLPGREASAGPGAMDGEQIAASEHAAHDCASHASPPPPKVPGHSATALAQGDLPRVDKIRVSAHQSSVLMRKENGRWVLLGKQGCGVADEVISRALENLTSLTVEQRLTAWPAQAQFDLQVNVLVNDETLIHLELAQRSGDTDVVQLFNGDVVELRGLDREKWSSDATRWCTPP